MNDHAIRSPELLDRAREKAGHPIYLLDPRINELEGEPDRSSILGGFEVDAGGSPVASSFRYNPEHVLFDPEHGLSAILTDVDFYRWMHGDDGPDSP
jgi:hypothetical protein